MVDRVAEDVVELDGVRRHAVQQRRGAQWRALVDAVYGGLAVPKLVGQRAEQPGHRLDLCPRQQGREPIDQRALGVVAHLVRQTAGLLVYRIVGDRLDQGAQGRSPAKFFGVLFGHDPALSKAVGRHTRVL